VGRGKGKRMRGPGFGRFEKFFRVQVGMWELVNSLLDQETIKLRSGTDHDLSLLVGASLGKALKNVSGSPRAMLDRLG